MYKNYKKRHHIYIPNKEILHNKAELDKINNTKAGTAKKCWKISQIWIL